MSGNKSLLKKLISLVCAASSVGLSASAAESVQDEDVASVSAAVSGEDEGEYGEEQDDGFRSMSSLFDFTYGESAWKDRIEEDKNGRIDSVLSLDDLEGCASNLGTEFRSLVSGLAGECYEVRSSFAWSKGYINEGRLGSLLSGSFSLWGSIEAVCREVDEIIRPGVAYGKLRGSFKKLLQGLSDVVRNLDDMGFENEQFVGFVKSKLAGYLKTCDAVLAKRRIKSSLESDFSKQLQKVVVRSGADEAVDAAE